MPAFIHDARRTSDRGWYPRPVLSAEVDAFLDAIRDTFPGVRRPPLMWHAAHGKQFATTRRLRSGYDPEQVDAFLDKAEPRLAAMRATDRGDTIDGARSGLAHFHAVGP
jgi:DivIVA domain-containing protein